MQSAWNDTAWQRVGGRPEDSTEVGFQEPGMTSGRVICKYFFDDVKGPFVLIIRSPAAAHGNYNICPGLAQLGG